MKQTIDGLVSRYNQELRNLVNVVIRDFHKPTKIYPTFEKFIKRRTPITNLQEWNIFCACMDLIEDTNEAIQNFIKFKIEGPTKYNDLGEKYLRIYGFLNAIYMQQNSVLSLCTLFGIPNIKEQKGKILGLKIREMRNKLASHSNSYKKHRDEEADAIFLIRVSLSGTNLMYGTGSRAKQESLNLSDLLNEHLRTMVDLLDVILEQGVRSMLGKKKRLYDAWKDKLSELREEKKGNYTIKMGKFKISIQTNYQKP